MTPTAYKPGMPMQTAPPATTYNNAIGYLRAVLVVMVVAHHAALAYHPYAPPINATLAVEPRWWQAFPVVDAQRWSGALLLVGFNDIFFMSLMFFLSGLFVWQGLKSKGTSAFLRDRALRLGIPFVVAAAILAPLAYYPAYLQLAAHSGFDGFWNQWLSLGQWPAGPAWFIWVLLAFDAIAALLYTWKPKWGETLAARLPGAPGRPLVAFLALAAITALVYIPLAIAFNPMRWSAFGPFTFQTSRILHYFTYFVAGIGVGALGLENGLISASGNLARRWGRWVTAGLAAFVIAAVLTIVATTNPAVQGWTAAAHAGFVVSCAAISFAFLAVFLRFANRKSASLDSLRRNSYGIYLLHYAFVSWLQYALLPAGMPGLAKFAIAFLGAVALSWMTSAALRRIPAVARIV
ncbi:acyltransferase family protein [Paludibaculum fermentans]|uniref:Acyltransferase n=1 Tax=Paludibaculum fermentans TaxID=1473598 RepID=A0A7S7NUK9_PALFE|nr:acyltransferase [Paludibaculum fermentans]QOY90121.1 acyltransferase [Paludibaculum fermentans]